MKAVVAVHQDLIAVIASGALGSIISTLVAGWLSWSKFKEESKEKARSDERDDIDYYRKMWREDEDEIDKLRDRIRALEDMNEKQKRK